jgi:hypothetical protein
MTRRSGPYLRDTAMHYLWRAGTAVRDLFRREETPPWVTVSAGGLPADVAAGIARTLSFDLGQAWRNAGAAVVGTLEPPQDLLARGIVQRSGLEDTDPDLIERLREAGKRWGPLGVARVAANLTDPDVLVQSLRQRDRGPAVPVTGWDLEPWQRRQILRDTLLNHHLERRTADGPIDGCECGELRWGQGWSDHVADVLLEALDRGHAVTSADPLEQPEQGEDPAPWPPAGYTLMPAGQITEFLGRQVILPPGREAVPEGPVVLLSARFGHLQDGDQSPDVVLVTLEGLSEPYALMPSDRVAVRDVGR